jgi:ketose-bisphosphate aldolase
VALVHLSQLLNEAQSGGYALGYFESWDTYSLEAVAEAAEEERSPVVLGFGGMMMDQPWLDRFGIEPLGAYGRAIAERTKVPVALMLNEVWELEHALRGIRCGFNTVMLNTCHLPFEENVRLTRKVVACAHPNGVEVQAELGRLPEFGGEDSGELTDPDRAEEFVKATGIDFLAVSVGNVHLQTEGKSPLDLDRLRAIREKVRIPLVIHGGSGFPEDAVHKAIDLGVALFHVGTVMKKGFFESTRAALAALAREEDYQAVVGSRKPVDFLLPGKQAVKDTVRGRMRLYGSSGKAT